MQYSLRGRYWKCVSAQHLVWSLRETYAMTASSSVLHPKSASFFWISACEAGVVRGESASQEPTRLGGVPDLECESLRARRNNVGRHDDT